ncbi:MAG: hypothetical protein ACI4P0_04050 [Mailhella sp.]
MTEKKTVTLGRFFPPLWILGAGALGSAALCIYIGAGVMDAEERRADLETKLEEHRKILEQMPVMKQEFDDLEKRLAQARSEKAALEASIAGLRDQESEVRRLIARRDGTVAERDEAAKTLRLFQDQQSALLKDKAQAEQDRTALMQELASLRGERDGLLVGVDKARSALAELEARMQAQKKLNELVQKEQKELEGFSTQVTAALGRFTSSAEAMAETGKSLAVQGEKMRQEAEAFAGARESILKRHDETVHTFDRAVSTDAEAHRQAVAELRRQVEAVGAEAREFSRQMAEGRKSASELTGGLQAVQKDMTEAGRTLQDVAAMAAALSKARSTLNAAVSALAKKSDDLEKSIHTLFQESAALRDSRVSLDETRKALNAAAGAVSQSIRDAGKAVPVSMPYDGQSVHENNETSAEHDPAQEQR